MQNLFNSFTSAHTCQLILMDLKGEHHFNSAKIIRMQARDNYTIVYFDDRPPFTVSKVLKIYDELLQPYGFVRTHRSHLVNRQFIKRIEDNTIVMQDASTAGLSRRNKNRIIRQMISQAV